MSDELIKVGVNVFILKNNSVLLGKRIGKVGYGTWCLPGGHLEYGESLMEGAKRELKEETNIDAEELTLASLVNGARVENHYIHINFLANKWSGKIKVTEPEKFEEWKFFDLENLPENIFAGHTRILPAFIEKQIFVD